MRNSAAKSKRLDMHPLVRSVKHLRYDPGAENTAVQPCQLFASNEPADSPQALKFKQESAATIQHSP
jgi:hypothetical protein